MKINDDLCSEVVQGHDNHCVTFAVEYLGNRQTRVFVTNDDQ